MNYLLKTFLLIILMCLSLSACSEDDNPGTTNEGSNDEKPNDTVDNISTRDALLKLAETQKTVPIYDIYRMANFKSYGVKLPNGYGDGVCLSYNIQSDQIYSTSASDSVGERFENSRVASNGKTYEQDHVYRCNGGTTAQDCAGNPVVFSLLSDDLEGFEALRRCYNASTSTHWLSQEPCPADSVDEGILGYTTDDLELAQKACKGLDVRTLYREDTKVKPCDDPEFQSYDLSQVRDQDTDWQAPEAGSMTGSDTTFVEVYGFACAAQ